MSIFKIKSNVFDEKIGRIAQSLSKDYSLLFLGETLYVCPNHYKQEINFKKALKPQRDYLVSELDENNLKLESDVVQNWCKERMARLDLQRLEDNKQDYIKDILNYLDELDSYLEETAKKGDET